jgi:hypothetical protein
MLRNREDIDHLKHVCMGTNLVTDPDTAWQGNWSCIEKDQPAVLLSTALAHVTAKLFEPISVENNFI